MTASRSWSTIRSKPLFSRSIIWRKPKGSFTTWLQCDRTGSKKPCWLSWNGLKERLRKCNHTPRPENSMPNWLMCFPILFTLAGDPLMSIFGNPWRVDRATGTRSPGQLAAFAKIAYTSDTWVSGILSSPMLLRLISAALKLCKNSSGLGQALGITSRRAGQATVYRLIEVQNPPIVKYPRVFDGIALFLSALASENESHKLENAPQILAFMLSHRWQGQKAFSIRGVKSQPNFHSKFNLSAWKTALRTWDWIWSTADTASKSKSGAEKSSCLSWPKASWAMPTGFREDAFNSLTLDYGRFYVEHCLNFWDPLADGLCPGKQRLWGTEVAHRVGITDKTLVAEWAKILQGIPAEDLREGFTITTRQALVAETTSLFNEYYHEANFISRGAQRRLYSGYESGPRRPRGQEHIDRDAGHHLGMEPAPKPGAAWKSATGFFHRQ